MQIHSEQNDLLTMPLTMAVRKKYNKWRLRVLIWVIIAYATYYLCRQNFSMIMPALMAEFGYSKTELGWILTSASIVYGIGRFVNGYLTDKSNARYIIVTGLLCSALVNYILGFVSNSLMFLAIFIILNNWFQSMGWPPVARILTHWFASSELGMKWAYGATSHQAGAALTIIISAYLIANYGWRSAFFVPAGIAIIIALILINRLRESPQEVNLPQVEIYKNITCTDQDNTAHLPTKTIIKTVFCNKNMWYICFANMCLYTVRLGVLSWGPLFLQEFKHVSLTDAGLQVAACEISGLLGGLSAGWISDKIFKGRRGPAGSIFMLALAVALYIFWQLPPEFKIINSAVLILAGFLVYGSQVLIGVASADFTAKGAVGTANGLVGTMGYVGSSFSGIGVGLLSDYASWDVVFIFFIFFAILGSVFFYLTKK